MTSKTLQKILWLLLGFGAVWLAIRYLLPVLLPFALGGLLALAAEPAVRFGTGRLRLPRSVAAGAGVALTLVLLLAVLSLLGALAVRELGLLAGTLPAVGQSVREGMTLLQDWLIGLAGRLPDTLGTLVTGTATQLLGSGSALVSQLASYLPGLLGSLLGWLPDGALGLGTGILAGFMISARLPWLRQLAKAYLPKAGKLLPALGRVRKSVGLWLRAQLKLSAVTYTVVALGLVLLGVPYGAFWALLVALVDAVPVLGTGTVLLPWALTELLGGDTLRAVGLLATYAVALLLRTVLEPRMVGKHLGLDPLLTLLFLYGGYCFWGIPGMILAPMLAAAARGLTAPAEG